jgi:hypothetical protein
MWFLATSPLLIDSFSFPRLESSILPRFQLPVRMISVLVPWIYRPLDNRTRLRSLVLPAHSSVVSHHADLISIVWLA